MAEALGVIDTNGLPRPVLFAWHAAQLFGWAYVRAHLPRSTWYRYLEVLRAAGVPVSEDEGLHGHKSQLESSGWGTLAPGQVCGLPGRRFRVVQAWDPDFYSHDFYPVGTTGVVTGLLFHGGVWQVIVDLDALPGDGETLSIADFLARTAPLEDAAHG